jgi:succinate dehydrogenase / fumarate reductase, flavoprotein subunit
VVYGRRTGAAIAQYIQHESLPALNERHYLDEAKQKIQQLLDQSGDLRIHHLRQKVQDCVTEFCGVFRTHDLIVEGLTQLKALQQTYPSVRLDDKGKLWNTEITEALELHNLIVVAEIIMTGALHRQESRGAHSREDYPNRVDETFLKHTLAFYESDRIRLDYMPVNLNLFEPQERRY